MRVTERELDHAPLDLATVADADDLELPLEGRLHARHHVLDQRPREAVEGADLTVLVRARDDDLVAVDLRAEPRRQGLDQPALGALGAHPSVDDLNLHALRDRDGLLADT